MENSISSLKVIKKFTISMFIITVLFFIFYYMEAWLIPFFIAFILAYALHAPTKTLSVKLHISQSISAGILILLLISAFGFFVVFMIPLIKNAMMIIINKIPKLIECAPIFVNDFIKSIFQSIGLDRAFNIENELEKYFLTFTSDLPIYILNFLNTGMALIYIIMFVFMTPILTFYLLKDWNKIESYTRSILKKISSPVANNIIYNINTNLAAYIKGQTIICFILSILYSIGIYFIGTKEFIICGIFSGILSIAPFFGPFIGIMTTITMSIDDFMYGYQYALLCCLYVVIPFLDSNFITPKIIGSKTGIHPFWIFFSICATVAILGSVGIFIAIPIAVIFSTICKEMAKRIDTIKQ
ncbi:MAG: AI-2E family transporter [Holosporales bacterium]|nr:AI-2E family transporter [Holosporales bacterium]